MSEKEAHPPSQNVATEKARRWPRWAKAALAVYRVGGTVTSAAEKAGVTRRTIERLRESNASFREAWEEAREESADLLEAEARRRALEGWEEPVFGSGGPGRGTEEVGVVRKYDTTLLIFLLKGERPEKYRERYDQKISGSIDLADVIAAAHAAGGSNPGAVPEQ